MNDKVHIERDEFDPLVESLAFLNASPRGIVVMNECSEILYVNTEMTRITGYSEKALLEMTINCLIPKNPSHPFNQNFLKLTDCNCGKLKTETLGSVPFRRADGKLIHVSVEQRSYDYGDRRRFSCIFKPVTGPV